MADPNTPGTSPFNPPAAASPFGEAAPPEDNTGAQNTATPMRTATMALALLNRAQQVTRDQMDDTMSKNLELSKQLIEGGQENLVRLQSVVEGTKDQIAGLNQIVGTEHEGQFLTPEIVKNVQDTTAADRANRIQDLSHSALEDEALRGIEDKVRGGDYVEAAAAINSLDPTKNNTYNIKRDFYHKDLIISNAIEKANFDNDQEGFWHKLITGLVSVPEAFLFQDNRQSVGLVDKGVGGYQGSGLLDYIFPGSAMQEQVRALHNLNAEQLGQYLPQLLSNIKYNSAHLFLHDPGTQAYLLSLFKGDFDNYAKNSQNIESFVNIALMAPMLKGVGTGLAHGTELLTGMGARQAARNRVANAFEEMATNGAKTMTAKTAVVPDELIQEGLPSSVNPLLVPKVTTKTTRGSLLSGTAKLDPNFVAPTMPEKVSMAGDVAEQVAYVHEALTSSDFNSIKTANRFFTPEEKQVAVNAALDEIKTRTKTNVLDYTPEAVRLDNGQEVTQLDITLNKPFATPEEARNWLHENGYGADITNAVEREGPKADLKLYHGTSKDFNVKDIKPGESGSMGKGIYLTPDKEVAAGYGDKVHEIGIDSSKVFDFTKGYTPEEAYKVLDDLGIDKAKFKEWKSHQNMESLEVEARYSDTPGKIPGDQLSLDIDNFHKDPEVLNDILKKKGFAGRSTDIYGQPVINMFDKGGIIQDTSGQYFPRVKVFMRETGFYTNDLNPPKQHFMARWFSTPFGTSDANLAAKGTTSGQTQQQMLRYIKDLNKSVTKLGPNDRAYLREVVQKGVNEARWFSPSEFDLMWERATGKTPSDTVKAAYANYRTANDTDFVLRNANTRAELITRGVESVKFDAGGKPVEGFGTVHSEPTVPSDARIFDAGTGVHYKPGELTQARMDELAQDGRVLVKTEDPIVLKDGTTVDHFLVRKGELETNQVPEYVLPYSEGGHRVYADKYFVKAPKFIKQPDSDTMALDKPNVYVTASTKAEAAKWAEVMNAARLAVKEGMSAEELDAKIFRGQRNFPNGEDFIKGMQDGTYPQDHNFEAVFDRELPSVYASSGGKFGDESGATGFYRTNGQLYYSKKGAALKNVNGDLAPTVDPFKMMNQALFNVARLSSFDDFKTSAIQRWVNTYGNFLDRDPNASPAEIFNSAKPSRSVNTDLVHQIEGQREAIKRMLNFRSNFDLEKENALRRLHEWIVGDGDSKFRTELSKMPLNWLDRSPVQTLRGLAFDMKLGFLNIGQFFVQTSTMFSAMAMSPSAGLKGMFLLPATMAYRLGSRSENVLDLLAKRGFAKLGGFGSEKEFKDYIRWADRSGFFAFGDSQLLVNTSHPAAAYSILDKTQSLRQMGRFFFNEAEQANRTVAMRIAYDEAVKRFGGAKFGEFQFDEFVRARAENYSFNMSSTSAAAWQKGLLSIPTQFWAYNWRMLEALAGKQFTNAQKARLLMSQLFMGGLAGVPFASLVTDYYNHKQGSAPRLSQNPEDPSDPISGAEKTRAVLERGMVDELIHLTTGADVQVGQRLATGDFFTQTAEKLMGFSEYGQKTTPADMLGGATYSIFGEALGSGFAIAQHWAAAETGGIPASDLTRFDVETMLRQISSVNNIYFKAWAAHQYGIYETAKGRALVSDLPPADAAFIAMGFAPGELRDREAIMAWKTHHQDMINDSATFVNRLWTESVREPDKADQNAKTVSQFIGMLPADQRMEVLRKAHLERDPSDYARLLKIRQSRQTEAEAQDKIDELYSQQEQDNQAQPNEEAQQ